VASSSRRQSRARARDSRWVACPASTYLPNASSADKAESVDLYQPARCQKRKKKLIDHFIDTCRMCGRTRGASDRIQIVLQSSTRPCAPSTTTSPRPALDCFLIHARQSSWVAHGLQLRKIPWTIRLLHDPCLSKVAPIYKSEEYPEPLDCLMIRTCPCNWYSITSRSLELSLFSFRKLVTTIEELCYKYLKFEVHTHVHFIGI
jgi:hypothetical protein